MKCPFVNAVSKGLFQRSNLSLSSAINHCPFILQTRAAHQSVSEDVNPVCESVNNAIRKRSQSTLCPYTSGKEAPGPVCPITGIDVSRNVHSDVLHQIHADSTEVKNPVTDDKPPVPPKWRQTINTHLDAKKVDGTYRTFSVVNKDARRTPTGDRVTRNKAFAEPQEIYCANDYLNMSRHPKVNIKLTPFFSF